MLTGGVAQRSIDDAFETSRALLALARERQCAAAAASVVDEQVLVLGAHQLASRVLVDPRERRARRRPTTGTAVWFDEGGIVLHLALPSVDAIWTDAVPATLLNRNVRLFLAGLTKAGVPAAYFGREWIAAKKRPLGVLGLDVTPEGAVLLELYLARAGSLALPRALVTDLEATCDRYRQHEPTSLADWTHESAASFAARALDGVLERAGTVVRPFQLASRPPSGERAAIDLLPAGSRLGPALHVPIGLLDRAVDPLGRRFVGGDLLGPVHALGFGAPFADPELPVFGASWSDVAAAIASL
jgi:hypothetical protein